MSARPAVGVAWHWPTDCFPRQFVKTERGWRERLVSLREPTEGDEGGAAEKSHVDGGVEGSARNLEADARDLDFVLSPTPTSAQITSSRCDHSANSRFEQFRSFASCRARRCGSSGRT